MVLAKEKQSYEVQGFSNSVVRVWDRERRLRRRGGQGCGYRRSARWRYRCRRRFQGRWYRRRDYRWCTRRGGRRGNWVQHHQERARKGNRQRARCGKRSESRRGGRWSAWAQSGQEEGMAQASRLSGCPTQCLSGPLPSGLLSFMCSTDIAYGIITLMTTPRRRAECSRLRLLMLIVILLPA